MAASTMAALRSWAGSLWRTLMLALTKLVHANVSRKSSFLEGDPRQRRDRLNQCVIPQPALAIMLQPAVKLADHRSRQQRHAEFAGELQHQIQILLLQVDGESRFPVVVQHLWSAFGEHPTAGRSGLHRAHRF